MSARGDSDVRAGRPLRSARRPALSIMLVLAGLVTLGVAVPSRAAACAGAKKAGPWTTLTLPTEAARYPALRTSFGVAFGHGSAPDTLYVPVSQTIPYQTLPSQTTPYQQSLPRTILRSRGGCDWTPAFSLDDLPPTSLGRAAVTYNFVSLTVSSTDAKGHYSVYAVAISNDTAVTLPALVASSLDDGVHWAVRELGVTTASTDYPRCGQYSTIHAGVDAKTVYLLCDINALTEFLNPGACRTGYYVTHDGGNTWTTVGRQLKDPNQPTAPCPSEPEWLSTSTDTTRPDQAQPGTVWTGGFRDLYRSTDDGRTFTPFAKTDNQPSDGGFAMTRRGSVSHVLKWGRGWVAAGTGGKLPELAAVPIHQVAELGAVRAAAYVPGSADVVVFYTDGKNRARAFRYSALRRTWSELVAPPAPSDRPAWDTGSIPLVVVGDGRTRALYVVSVWNGSPQVLRLALT